MSFTSKIMQGALAIGAMLPFSVAMADEFEPALQSYFDSEISAWVQDPGFVAAIRASNAMTQGYSAADIEALDQQWRGEVGGSVTPTITPILESDLANHLREIVAQSDQTVTEIILMDAHGLNVAVSSVTSDLWQGDEAKHQETYGVGAGAVHISDVEFDESTQSYQGQISVAITDPETGGVVGAITVGVNVDALM